MLTLSFYANMYYTTNIKPIQCYHFHKPDPEKCDESFTLFLICINIGKLTIHDRRHTVRPHRHSSRASTRATVHVMVELKHVINKWFIIKIQANEWRGIFIYIHLFSVVWREELSLYLLFTPHNSRCHFGLSGIRICVHLHGSAMGEEYSTKY